MPSSPSVESNPNQSIISAGLNANFMVDDEQALEAKYGGRWWLFVRNEPGACMY